MSLYQPNKIILNGKYKIEKQLGAGAFGEVYLVTHLDLGVQRAVKVAHRDMPGFGSTLFEEAFDRFRQEAQIGARLKHDNLIQVFDFYDGEESLHLVMEYAAGGSLEDRLREKLAQGENFTVEETLKILKDVASGLAILHDKRNPIVHRDLKPSNILFDAAGKAKIADLGLAQVPGGLSQRSRLGSVAQSHPGTPAYMSPEQENGTAMLTTASDIYTVGIILFEMLSGLLYKMQRKGTSIIYFNSSVPEPIEKLLSEMLAEDPQSRIWNGAELESKYSEITHFVSFHQEEKKEIKDFLENVQHRETDDKISNAAQLGSEKTIDNKPIDLKKESFPAKTTTEKQNKSLFSKPIFWIISVSIASILLAVIFSPPGKNEVPNSEPTLSLPTPLSEETKVPITQVSENPTVEANVNVNNEEFLACMVTDTGGIDDQSFNATTWNGFVTSIDEMGIEAKYLVSEEVADYDKNINAFVEENCDLIVTVGFLLGDATKASAEMNPDIKYSIVDFSYNPVIENVIGQVYQTDQAAFLAGYLAAGITKSGKVGTYGGLPIPPVTIFMDGFTRGVHYYNETKGTTIKVIGWDIIDTEGGLFTYSFDDQSKGKEMGNWLLDQGVDIILPVAGPVGFGTAEAVADRGNAYIIGTDSDWAIINPDNAEITLTSILKNMDVTTNNVIKATKAGSFNGGIFLGTLSNGGVGLAPYYNLDSVVSDDMKAELENVRLKIINGSIQLSSTYKIQ